jgi:hypothetical protein
LRHPLWRVLFKARFEPLKTDGFFGNEPVVHQPFLEQNVHDAQSQCRIGPRFEFEVEIGFLGGAVFIGINGDDGCTIFRGLPEKKGHACMLVERILDPQSRIKSESTVDSMSVVGILPMVAENPASAAALQMVRFSWEAPNRWKKGCPP